MASIMALQLHGSTASASASTSVTSPQVVILPIIGKNDQQRAAGIALLAGRSGTVGTVGTVGTNSTAAPGQHLLYIVSNRAWAGKWPGRFGRYRQVWAGCGQAQPGEAGRGWAQGQACARQVRMAKNNPNLGCLWPFSRSVVQPFAAQEPQTAARPRLAAAGQPWLLRANRTDQRERLAVVCCEPAQEEQLWHRQRSFR